MPQATLPPTQRKLKAARAAGYVPFSPLACRVLGWLAALLTLPLVAARLQEGVTTLWRDALRPVPSQAVLPQRASSFNAAQWGELAEMVLHVVAPLAGAAFFVTWVAGVVQRRGLGFPTAAQQRPHIAWRSSRALFLLGAGGAALLLAGTVLAYYLPSVANALFQPGPSLSLVGLLSVRMFAAAAGVLLLAAMIDYGLAHFGWRSSLSMTRAELDQEKREEYGSPQLRRARRHVYVKDTQKLTG